MGQIWLKTMKFRLIQEHHFNNHSMTKKEDKNNPNQIKSGQNQNDLLHIMYTVWSSE